MGETSISGAEFVKENLKQNGKFQKHSVGCICYLKKNPLIYRVSFSLSLLIVLLILQIIIVWQILLIYNNCSLLSIKCLSAH